MDFFLEAGDQFAVGGDQRLLGFDLGDDGLLRGERWEGYLELANLICGEILEHGSNRLGTVAGMLGQKSELEILREHIFAKFTESDESVMNARVECQNGRQSGIATHRDDYVALIHWATLRSSKFGEGVDLWGRIHSVAGYVRNHEPRHWSAKKPLITLRTRRASANDGADRSDLHHRPVGVDGDVGAVVVEDGAGAVDDFLVALDLRHDLLLHLQRR